MRRFLCSRSQYRTRSSSQRHPARWIVSVSSSRSFEDDFHGSSNINRLTLASAPASAAGAWSSAASSGPVCSPFGGGYCNYVTISLSSAVSPGRLVCAITGVATSAAPAAPVLGLSYPMYLYDAAGAEVAASYCNFLFSMFLLSLRRDLHLCSDVAIGIVASEIQPPPSCFVDPRRPPCFRKRVRRGRVQNQLGSVSLLLPSSSLHLSYA
jgi:hypothetical protein